MPYYRVDLTYTNVFQARDEARAIGKAHRDVREYDEDVLNSNVVEITREQACEFDDEYCNEEN